MEKCDHGQLSNVSEPVPRPAVLHMQNKDVIVLQKPEKSLTERHISNHTGMSAPSTDPVSSVCNLKIKRYAKCILDKQSEDHFWKYIL